MTRAAVPERPQVALGFGIAPDGGTAIVSRHVEWPWSLPRGYRRAGVLGPLTVLPQCAGAALLPGDHWRHRIELLPGAQVDLISAGALLVHADARAPRAGRADWRLRVAAGALLRHVPDPVVLMPGARMEQRIELCLEPGGRAVLFDGFCRQRPDAPDTGGLWQSALRVSDPEGRVLLQDRQAVSEAELLRLRALPGAPVAFGSALVIGGAGLPEGALDLPGCHAAVGALRGGAGSMVRIAAASGGALDRAFHALRARLS